MLVIKVKEGEKIERALKRMKRKFRNTKVLQELRERRYYTKPSVAHRKKIQKASYIQSIRDKEEI